MTFFYTKYIWAVWKRAKNVNILTVVYMIPFLTFIMSLLSTNIFPVIAQYAFINNSNYNYMYKLDYMTDQKILEDLNQESLFIGNHNSIYVYKEDIITASMQSLIHLGTPDSSLTHTKFTIDNFLSFNGELKDNSIYLSYDCTKALNLHLGDTCTIEFNKYDHTTKTSYKRKVEFKVAGILKPNYEDSQPSRSPNNNLSLAILDEESLNWLKDKSCHFDDRYYYIYYANEFVDLSKYQEDNINFSYSTKEDLLRKTKEYYLSPSVLVSKGATIIVSFATLFAILLFELRYLRKKHSRNIRIICMLGLSRKGVKELYMGLALANFLIASIISFVLLKFIILDLIIKLYYTFLQLSLLFLAILVFSVLFSYLQSRKIRVV